MSEPIRHQDAWWHQQPDGTWLRFNESTQTWEPQAVQGQPVYAPKQGLSTGAKWAIGIGITAVVLLIVMILAAIAIPVFLRQREKASTSQVESALKNAATAQESHCTTSPQCYTTSVEDLYAEGLKLPSGVQMRIASADQTNYCIEARHELLPNEIWSYSSELGQPVEGPCL